MNLIVAGVFSMIFLLGWISHAVYIDYNKNIKQKQPTVKCADGKLYDVSYDGNITIYEKRPFTTCEERQMIEFAFGFMFGAIAMYIWDPVLKETK